MKNKYVGMLILGMAIIFFFLALSFNNALNSIVNTTCTHGSSCPMNVTLKTQEIISYSLIGLLIVVGVLITFFMKDEQTTIIKHEGRESGITPEEKMEKLNNLDERERKVMDIILREKGSAYQSDLIKETGLNKVKITRILDKLEGRNLIERKRRGMANIVISK